MKLYPYFSIALLVSLSLAFGSLTNSLDTPSFARASNPSTHRESSTDSIVSVKSEHLTGLLPIGLPVVVRLNAELSGDDVSSLAGEGRHFASTGAHNYWPATGSISGTTVTLSGTVTDSNAPYLIGSPVTVLADSATEEISLSFGPLAGGPFAGQTLVFTGSGQVKVKQPD